MIDFKINKEEYPHEIIYVFDEKGGYLTEGENTYRPISAIKTLIYAPLSLKLISPLSYTAYAGERSGSEFNAIAKLTNTDNSLSFFGTDREIKNIYINIFSIDKGIQLQFEGDLSQNYDNYFISDSQEYLYITMAIKPNQFKKILRMWELDNIEKMGCELRTEIINGLYQWDSHVPYASKYKVLPDKRIVKNHQEMPENFTDFNTSKTYYIFNDCFNLKIIKQKSFQNNNKNNFEEQDEDNFEKQDEKLYLNVIINNVEKIIFYTQYVAFIMTIIMLYILFK